MAGNKCGGRKGVRAGMGAVVLAGASLAVADDSPPVQDAPVSKDEKSWLDGMQMRDWLNRETDRAWRAEQHQTDVREAGPAAGSVRASVERGNAAGHRMAARPDGSQDDLARPRLQALYGSGAYKAAELEIAGTRYVLATDRAGRLAPQRAADYQLIAIHGQCVYLRRAGVRTDLCWRERAPEER
ncbi:hypothetical protein [Kerstersia sp.]|uniref:hypothetical protein n=1 Tax=Kerstersia sp. TaxID=1930783 RepID=UPI003F93DA6E